jgi:hypothetical protein
MRLNDDPASMNSDERIREVARIFADGVLRLHARTALTSNPNFNNLPKSSPDGLEDCVETGLSVHLG